MKIIVCLLLAVSLASSEHCPSGWIDALDLGCLYFGSEHTTWLEASLYCEELMNSSSSMIEIFSQDENDLLSLIGTLELSLTGADGWWIGLDDIGHEGKWRWQSSSTLASYFSWAENRPSSDVINRDDCVFMSLDLSKNEFVWTDDFCDSQGNDVKIAPLCQLRQEPTSTTVTSTVRTSTSPSTSTTTKITTTATTTTTTTTTTTPRLCPESLDVWSWIPYNGNCYKVIDDKHFTWRQAQNFCREEGDLVSIHSLEENNYVGQLIIDSGLDGAYIGAFTESTETCSDTWGWSDGSSWNFTRWYPDSPHCSYYDDYFCAFIESTDFGFRWNNENCDIDRSTFPFVCKTNQLKQDK